MLSERDRRERRADRENERTIAEYYCKAFNITDEPFQHVALHPVDYSIFKDGVFERYLEIRVRGKTIQKFKKEGWIPVGEPKWKTLLELNADFINLIPSEGSEYSTLYALMMGDVSRFDGYTDRRPYRHREWVYKVPISNFIPLVGDDGELIKIPNKRIHFRKKGKDTTDFNKSGPRGNSADTGVQRSQR